MQWKRPGYDEKTNQEDADGPRFSPRVELLLQDLQELKALKGQAASSVGSPFTSKRKWKRAMKSSEEAT